MLKLLLKNLACFLCVEVFGVSFQSTHDSLSKDGVSVSMVGKRMCWEILMSEYEPHNGVFTWQGLVDIFFIVLSFEFMFF